MSKKFKVWPLIGPLPFTTNGTTDGIITLASTFGLYVGQLLTVSANTLPTKNVEIKDVISKTQIRVGPQDGNPTRYTAVDLYTVALNASLTAPEQSYGIDAPNGQVLAGVYENLPIAALRTILTDPFGFFYTLDNPLPVQIGDTGDGGTTPATTPIIFNSIIPAANTEQSYMLPPNTKKIKIKARGNSKLQFSFSAGTSATNFITIFPGSVYIEDSLNLTSKTIYYQATKVGEIVEILTWI